jgi:hypothetical protein
MRALSRPGAPSQRAGAGTRAVRRSGPLSRRGFPSRTWTLPAIPIAISGSRCTEDERAQKIRSLKAKFAFRNRHKPGASPSSRRERALASEPRRMAARDRGQSGLSTPSRCSARGAARRAPQGDGSRDGVCDAVPITVCAQAGNRLNLSASLCYQRAEHGRRAFRPPRVLLANKIMIGGRPP